MMTMTRLMLVLAVMMMVAAPAFSAEVMHTWKCEMEDGVTEAEVRTGAKEWLDAAKKVKGGENFKAYVQFPVAVNATGEFDTLFVVVVPTFEEWGRFWDNYANSAAAAIEVRNQEKIACPDSAVWESFEVK